MLEQRSREAQELALAYGEKVATLPDFCVKPVREAPDCRSNLGSLKRVPQCRVSVLIEWVKIIAHRARKHQRVLGQHRDCLAQHVERH